MRIAIAGFQHETNTFAPTRATYDRFVREDAWPGLTRGAAILDVMSDRNISSSGFIAAAREAGHELVPIIWANASPSSYVTDDSYERVAAMVVDGLASVADSVDAVYLDLHGAMVAESFEDGEGELLRRVRAVVGPDKPVVASLDLHCNTTPEMIAHADALIAYRTYPHVDMAETGARCVPMLERILAEGRPAKAFRQIPFLITISWQCTMIEPARGIYGAFDDLERDHGLWSLSFTPGFPPADIHHCGPALMAYAATQDRADAGADALERMILAARDRFDGRFWTPDEAVAEAMRRAPAASKPIILVDTQDNPGGGGDGNTTGMLRALVDQKAEEAALGLLCDPAAAAAAVEAGVGGRFRAALGGSGWSGDAPFECELEVEALGDGRFLCTGPMYRGSRTDIGPMARLRVAGSEVRVVVCSKKVQAADREMFRHVGIAPEDVKILVLKSSVHFRADFQPIAEDILIALAPGPVIADPAELPYRRLRKGMRLGPSGPAFEG